MQADSSPPRPECGNWCVVGAGAHPDQGVRGPPGHEQCQKLAAGTGGQRALFPPERPIWPQSLGESNELGVPPASLPSTVSAVGLAVQGRSLDSRNCVRGQAQSRVPSLCIGQAFKPTCDSSRALLTWPRLARQARALSAWPWRAAQMSSELDA